MVLDILVIALAVGIYIGWMIIWSFHFIALIYSKYKFNLQTLKLLDTEKQPGISIIKPLMGCDDNLFDNLETFFNINYPTYELLFCIQDNTDPAIGVVKRLFEKYPHVDAKLFTGGKHVGINPKINNMIQGYDVAKYDMILVSDAGLRTNKNTLTNMVSQMTDEVGLVHQLPFISDRKGLVANVEKVYFGTAQSRMYLTINCLGVPCVTGMSCLMRKKALDDMGGLKAFGKYIAEDYFLAKSFKENNWKIKLCDEPVIQNSATYSFSLWQSRMIRWCKLRLKMNAISWLEPLQECFSIGLAASWAVNFLFEWNSLVFFLVHVLCWFLSDYCLLKSIQNGKLPFSKFDYVIAWLYRESICYYLFFQAAIDPTVQWRHGKYRLRWGGLAEEISNEITEKSSSNKSTLLLSSSSTTSSNTSFINNNNSSSHYITTQSKHLNSQQSSTLTLIQQIPSSTSSILPATQQTNSLILNI